MDTTGRATRSRATPLAIALGALVILLLNCFYYLPFLADDSLISLRYVERLLEGNGLTWTEGRPVEGYSNLLWILAVAVPGLFGADPVAAARVLGVLGMAAVIPCIVVASRRDAAGRHAWLPPALALGFFALSAPVAAWAVGGLEQPLVAALLGLAVVGCYRLLDAESGTVPIFAQRKWDCPLPKSARYTSARLKDVLLASIPLGLLCLTRPDGPLFTAAAFFAIVAARRAWQRPAEGLRLSLLAVVPALFWLGQLLFRLGYYGEPVPNTALVKLAPSAHHFVGGAKYVARGLVALAPLSLVAGVLLLGSLAARRTRPKALLLLSLAGVWVAYLVFIGGDVFPAYRHVVPLVVLMAFALVLGANALLRHFEGRIRLSPFILAGAAGMLLIPFVYLQFADRENVRARTERWEWEGKVLATVLRGAFSEEQPLMAVAAAGCLPYWTGFPCVDMLGLNDYYLPRHPPEDFGTGLIGHELGDGRYVLSREPDLVVFGVGAEEPWCRSGREMLTTAEFRELYAPVKLHGTDPHPYTGVVWFRKLSPRVGIRQTGAEIHVPGFLLAADMDVAAYPGGDGRLVAPLRAGRPLGVSLPVPGEAAWQVEVRATRPEQVAPRLEQQSGTLRVILSTRSRDPIEVRELVLTPRKPPLVARSP